MRSLVFAVACLSLVGCRKVDNDKTPESEIMPPNVCKTVAIVGTFPTESDPDTKTWAYACFEGYEVQEIGGKVYLADSKCREGKVIAASGSEEGKLFVQLNTAICPTEGAVAVCQMKTSKVYAYNESLGILNRSKFEDYCKAKAGTLKFY